MNKCRLCQQITNNLTHVYNNRIRSLAQVILKLKGFQDSLELNNTFAICEKCKQGVENVSIFWENIPEAKPKLEELHDEKEESKTALSTASKQHLPAIKLAHPEECEDVSIAAKSHSREPIKLRIKLPRKRKRQHKPVNILEVEELPKRIRHYPKRYEDFDIASKNKPVLSDENIKPEAVKDIEISLNNAPLVAMLRLNDGQYIGKLTEVDSQGSSSRIRIVCLVCNEIFRFEKPFQNHFKTHNKYPVEDNEDVQRNYLYCCNLCDKTFCDRYAVRRHFTNTHTEERPFQCEFCEANFKYKFNLDYHMAKHVPKKHFECSFCGKNFLKRYELKIHLRTHTKERPYKCQFCSYASAHRSNLKTHQKIKHLNNAENLIDFKECNNILEEFPSLGQNFVPPQSLLEAEPEMKSYSNHENVLNFSTENVTSDLSNEYTGHDFSETENSLENIPLTDAKATNTNDQNTVKASEATEAFEENRISQAMLGTFTIDCSILKALPSPTLLGLKKWPKSFQTTPTLRDLERFDCKRNLNYAQNSIIKYTHPQNYSSDNSTQKNTISANSNSSTSNIKSNLNISTENILKEVNEFLNISKLQDTFSTRRQHEHHNDIVQTQFMNNKSETTETTLDMITECVETNNSKVIEFSARPVKIKNILTSTTSSDYKSLEPDAISKTSNAVATGNSLTFFEANSQQIETNHCLAISQMPKTFPKLSTNRPQQSLLKCNLKTQQPDNLSLTKGSGNLSTLPSKPLITKIEILPTLNTLDMLQTASATTASTNIIKPPATYKHQCHFCYKYFKQKSALNKHMRTHTGEKPYKCNLCAKSYADASNYKKHKIRHKTAAESLNIPGAVPYVAQSSPAYSTVSDPDPDGIEVMQTLKRFDCSSTEEDDEDMMDDISTTSSTMETDMWHNALEHALNNDELRENLMRNLAAINNAILPKSMQQIMNTSDLNKNSSTEDPD